MSYSDNKHNSIGAVITIIKCAVGAGCFALPCAFEKGGLWVATIMCLGLGSLSAYTLILLVKCEATISDNIKQRYEVINENIDKFNADDIVNNNSGSIVDAANLASHDKTLTYSDLGALIYPEICVVVFNRKINLVYLIILMSTIFTSIGVCVAYINFICETVQALSGISQRTIPLFLMPIILYLSYLKTFKVLAWTSALGDISVVVGCAVIIIYGIQARSYSGHVLHEIVNLTTIPEYFGSVGFLFAIHVVILPILQQLRMNVNSNEGTTDLLKQRIIVIIRSFVFITIFNALFGFMGYILFANSWCQIDHKQGPCSNVLGNLEGGAISTVKVLLCIDLMLTIPMVLASSREIIEKHFFHAFENMTLASKHSSTLRIVIRTLLVFCTFLFAVCFPEFSRSVNVVGGIVCSITGFILPPLLYTKLHHDHLSYRIVIFHRIITLFGIMLMILTIIFN